MTIYKDAGSGGRVAMVAAAVVVLGGAATWWWMSDKESTAPVSGAPVSEAAQAFPAVANDGFGDALATSQGQLPPNEEVVALAGALKGQAAPEDEARRVISYLSYQRRFEHWHSLEDHPQRANERRQIAESMLEELPQRVVQGEFTPMEGVMMGTVMLGTIETDEAKLAERVDAWTARIEAVAPSAENEQVQQTQDRTVYFKRLQAEAVDAWRKGGSQDQVALDRAMEEAQRWFASGADPQ